MNWKVRFKNKVWLTAFLAFVVSTVYGGLAMFDIVPAIPEDSITQIVATVLQFLTLLGIIVDPTTQGIADSTQAMGYLAPKERS